jgi:superfamily II DNA or RNA helicase
MLITPTLIDRFVAGTKGQALREGTRYAQEARVGAFVGSRRSATTVVRGKRGDFEVVLWSQDGGLAHRCTCPSWRDPCKHEIAAALSLRQSLAFTAQGTKLPSSVEKTDEARRRAVEERIAAARREKMQVKAGEPPLVAVTSGSGFSYTVHLRGNAEGPHSCDCPDFEANRLHTCKHVERVRTCLRSSRSTIPASHRRGAATPRIYLHFGEVVEPRLFGRPVGFGSRAIRQAFDNSGLPLRPLARDLSELRRWLSGFGDWVEPQTLGWLDERIERRPRLPGRELARLMPPSGLNPYPYQWTGAKFLATTGRALLADEMGLGKTVQALIAAAALHEATPAARHVTVICPASLRGGWQDEIRRWLGEEAVALEGPTMERAHVIASRPRWLITHYEQVLRDHEQHAAHAPDLLIIDEAQRAKGLRTRTARILKSIRSRYLFALTGTPLENRLEEAYAIAQLIDQRLLPPLWQIDRDHFVRDDKGRRVVLYRNLDALRAHLAPAFLRRRKEDVLPELPGRVRSTVMVPMHPAVVSTYDDVMFQVARIANKKVILPADLERMQRLLVIARRCCNGPHMLGLDSSSRSDGGVPKLAELEQILKDLCLGERRKAVVFSEWTDMTERVESLCRRLGLATFHLHGDIPVRKRPALIRAFLETDGPAVFISTDAGGVGLNLQAADAVVNLDLPWNPARLEQRIARVHRIGSRRTVQEILIICKESVEERILALHDTKRKVLESIWSRQGEDVIAAPGGSGAFREMVQALLRTHAPCAAESPAPAARAAAEMVGASERLKSGVKSGELPEEEGASTGLSTLQPAPVSPADRALPPPSVDPRAVAAAVAAVAPALPADHRRSLASVFRAIAEALEA